jgi:hypothetical protein
VGFPYRFKSSISKYFYGKTTTDSVVFALGITYRKLDEKQPMLIA